MGKKRVQGARKVARRPKKSMKQTTSKLKVPSKTVIAEAPVWPGYNATAQQIEKFRVEYEAWVKKIRATV